MPLTDQFDEILQEHPNAPCAVTLTVQPDPRMDAPKVAHHELLRRGVRAERRPAGVLHLTIDPAARVVAEVGVRALDGLGIRGELVDVSPSRPRVAYTAPSTLQGELAKAKAATGSPWGTACAGGTSTTSEEAA